VLLSGDRVYTAALNTLYVYSLGDLTHPIATYKLNDIVAWSALIVDNRIYLGMNDKKLQVFEISSLT
jgi:hypothetical protein